MLIMLVDYFGWGLWYSQFLHASLIYLTRWLWDWLSWLRILISLCLIAMFVEYIDMLIILIDLLSIIILILAWLFCSLHMHTLTIVYHSAWHVDSFTCILFWSSLSMIFCITIHLDCCILAYLVWTWLIYPELCLIAFCMTALLLRDCMSLVYVGSTYIPLPPTLLVSVIPFIPIITIASMRPSVCLLSDRARD